MKYISGVDITQFKGVKIKRVSNNKWYDGGVLLKQIKKHLEASDRSVSKSQFLSEYKEIKRIYDFFGLKISKNLIYKPTHYEEKRFV